MKLNKTMKKLIAYICSIAMVVASMAGYQASVNAAGQVPENMHSVDEATSLGCKWSFYFGGAGGTAGIGYFSGGMTEDAELDLYVEQTSGTQYGIQVWAPEVAMTKGTKYQYTIEFTADKEGTFYTKDDKSNSPLIAQKYQAGENKAVGTFTAADTAKLLIEMQGVASDTNFKFTKITYTDDFVEETTTPSTEDEEGYYSTISGQWTSTKPWSAFAGGANQEMKYKGTASQTKVTFDTKVIKNDRQDWQLQAKLAAGDKLFGPLVANNQAYKVHFKYTVNQAANVMFQINANDNTLNLEAGTHEIIFDYVSKVDYPDLFMKLSELPEGTELSYEAEFVKAEDDTSAAETVTEAAPSTPDGYTVQPEGWITFGEILGRTPDNTADMSKWSVYSGTWAGGAQIATKDGGDDQDTISIYAVKAASGNDSQYGIQIGRVFTELTPETRYDYKIDYTIDDVPGSFEGTETASAEGKVAVVKGLGNMLEQGQTFTVTASQITEVDVEAEAKVKEKLTSDDNIAKSKPAFSSSQTKNEPASKAFDGDLGSRWISMTKDDGVTVGVNLEAVYTISSVAFFWEGAYAKEYDIQVSTDGKEYQTVKTVTATKAETKEITLEPVEAQFIQVVCRQEAGFPFSIWEMGVFGEYKGEGITTEAPVTEPPKDYSGEITGKDNIAKGAGVTASSTDPLEAGGTTPGNLTDGNLGSYWASYFESHEGYPEEYKDNDYVVIDLGKPVDASTISKVLILWRTEVTLPATFSIEVSEDGAEYTQALESTPLNWNEIQQAADVNGISSYALTGLTGNIQYIKINMTGAKPYGYQVSEIAVIGEGEEPPTETKTEPPVGEKPAAPLGLVHAPGADGTLPYHFAWQPSEEAASYNFYVNDSLVANVTATAYDADESLFTEPGEYQISVTAVSATGVESDKTTITYKVEGNVPTSDETSTSSTDVEMTFEDVVGTNSAITRGNYTIWINQTNTMSFAVDPADSDHIQGKIVSNDSNWDQWAVQYKVIKTGLVPGEEYTISVDMKASLNDGLLVSDGDVASADLKNGLEVTFTRTMKADESGQIVLTIGAGQVGLGVVLDFSNVTVKDAEGNVVYPSAGGDDTTTTPEGGDDTTTTPEGGDDTTTTPEGGDDITTVPADGDATTVAPTTVAPTTKAPAVKVAKAKVKKAKKKLSAKKVKVSLKKIKGAKKYQVQISKNKKFKKKLVKKTVKKAKVTIKSKKIANKKKLYIRARAIKIVGGKKYTGKWSKPKKIKIKK